MTPNALDSWGLHAIMDKGERGQGSEISKEIVNLQVAEEEQNPWDGQIYSRKPRNNGTLIQKFTST